MTSSAVRLRARWLATTLLLGGVGALAGCGIPAESGPNPIQPPPPYEGLPSPTTPGPSQTPATGEHEAVLFLTRDGRLVQVMRIVDEPPTLETLLDALAATPTPPEQQARLTSALAGTDVIDGVRIDSGIATVMLAAPGLDVMTQLAQGLVIAQIVCTLDARDEVTGVVFERAGARVSVPRGDGSQTDGPLMSADYAGLLEPTRVPPL